MTRARPPNEKSSYHVASKVWTSKDFIKFITMIITDNGMINQQDFEN